MAEATAQVYVINMIDSGMGREDTNERLIREMDLKAESIEEVFDFLKGN